MASAHVVLAEARQEPADGLVPTNRLRATSARVSGTTKKRRFGAGLIR
ncbi:MAG TPA: hypothetical protein VFW80_12055 [Gaiellaceae bacterium]|nr:hypothetical protein [Gaiellaceae bacterium]